MNKMKVVISLIMALLMNASLIPVSCAGGDEEAAAQLELRDERESLASEVKNLILELKSLCDFYCELDFDWSTIIRQLPSYCTSELNSFRLFLLHILMFEEFIRPADLRRALIRVRVGRGLSFLENLRIVSGIIGIRLVIKQLDSGYLNELAGDTDLKTTVDSLKKKLTWIDKKSGSR